MTTRLAVQRAAHAIPLLFGPVAARIGELLVAAGAVSAADVEEALAVARAHGLRLASALISIGRVGPDDAARGLARQHGVPAALRKHLDGRDLALAAAIPAPLARAIHALPLAVQRSGDALVVCVRDPSPQIAARLQAVTERAIVLAVAPELLLAPLVAETYPDRPASESDIPIEVDVDLDTGSVGVPVDPLDSGQLQLVDLDDHGVAKDHSQAALSYPGFMAVGSDPSPAIARTATPRSITGPFAAIAPEPAPAPATTAAPAARTLALDPALVAITAAESADDVVDAMLAYLRHRFTVGVVFVVKDGLALGQVGFGNDVAHEAFTAIVVPLAQPSVLRIAHERAATYVGAPVEGSLVQDRLLRLFGPLPDRVVVVPVRIKNRVVNLVYGHGARGRIEDAAAELGTLAAACEEAFVRIILESKS